MPFSKNGATAEGETEIIAKFCGDVLFSTEESQDTALNSIFQKATQEQRTGIKNFFRKFILWIKEKLGKTSYTEQLQMLEDKWLNLIKNSEATEETGAVKYSVDNNTKKGVKYKYNDYATNVMQWANSADRKQGDINIFNRNGKEFVLVEANSNGDGGYVELVSGNIKEVKAEYDRYISEQTDRIDEIIEGIRSGQNEYNGYSFNDEIRQRNIGNTGQVRSKGIQNDSTGNTEYLRSSDKGTSNKINKENEASDEGAFSMPESKKEYSISPENIRYNQERYAPLATKNIRITQYKLPP